ncbi:acyl-CoA dehydrogenase family protein [Streptomyces tagetis]|uniref:DNA alkylation response protein n=1 Tax=Streptomyces tagetis TaxID=2820809 RepID=A0A940XIU0_9ACTN|nr:acyl-CoA dehydrogenase family protein [Streptomyces sp. RG38]MBQ0825380.1 DNA alkylation response protein [Streptomyces sp. RG38]
MAGSTHTVTNQAPPLVDYDVFTADRALAEAVRRHLAPTVREEALAELSELGRACGSAQVREWGEQADRNPPVLRTHDPRGRRVDEVESHPAWHRLLGKGVGAGLTSAWTRPGGHVRRAAGLLVWAQADAGVALPLSSTHAAVPALRAEPGPAAEWEPLLTSPVYDPDPRPPRHKAGALCGVALTEKQGGGPAAVTTSARPSAADGTYELTGHTWFCSAPMADGFLVLARTPGDAGAFGDTGTFGDVGHFGDTGAFRDAGHFGDTEPFRDAGDEAGAGPTCFLVPRVLPDGTRNPFRLQRLKDTLGHRSAACAEVEFTGARALRIGPEGHGARTLAQTRAATRLDGVVGSAALMRRAVAEAVHHCAHREVTGGKLADRALMRAVLADLAVESEAATVLALRLAAAWDDGGEGERALLRIALPAAAFRVTGRCAPVVVEAAECLGGNGYVEESGLPRLVRAAPLGSLWAGPGNVLALDAVRVLGREPLALDAYLTEVGRARGADRRLDRAIRGLLTELADLEAAEGRARRVAERLAVVLQGALLVRHGPPEVADVFCASRLGGDGGAAFGTLAPTPDLAAVVGRARPVS